MIRNHCAVLNGMLCACWSWTARRRSIIVQDGAGADEVGGACYFAEDVGPCGFDHAGHCDSDRGLGDIGGAFESGFFCPILWNGIWQFGYSRVTEKIPSESERFLGLLVSYLSCIQSIV